MTTKKQNTTKTSATAQVFNTLKVAKDGSNWRQVFNATQPLPFTVEDYEGKMYKVSEYIKAHAQFQGSKTCVTYTHEGKVFKEVETDELRKLLCPDYKKGTKALKPQKVATFKETFETLKELSKGATFEEILEAFLFFQDLESKRRAEKEQREKDEALISSLSPEILEALKRAGKL